MEISDDGKYNNVKLKSPVAIMRSSFKDFGGGDIAVKCLESTGFTIDYKGNLEYNTKTSATLVNAGNGGDFFVVLMPKASAKFAYLGTNGAAYPDWAINAGTYYTLTGTDGNPVEITAHNLTTVLPTVTTETNHNDNVDYHGGTVKSVNNTSAAVEQYCECGLIYAPGTRAQLDIDNGEKKLIKEMILNSNLAQYYYDFTGETGLTAGDTYTVRAYAIGENKTIAYGDIKTFVVGDNPQDIPASWTDGASPYVFTVASGRTVRFSQGNLQYIGSAATPYWKFAEHQFDIIGYSQMGTDAANIDRDLFCWGTSGWENEYNNICYQPYSVVSERYPTSSSSTYTQNNGYGYGPKGKKATYYKYSLTGDYANADWGVFNTIKAGNTSTNGWRTLTSDEWKYIFNSRSYRDDLWGLATIAGCTTGLIILPDKTYWKLPTDLAFNPGKGNGWNTNTYTYAQWKLMETNGAVFLPAAGERHDVNMGSVGVFGRYWSSSHYNSSTYTAYTFIFKPDEFIPDNRQARYYGYSVRLVK